MHYHLSEIEAKIGLKLLTDDIVVLAHIVVRVPEIFFMLNEVGKSKLSVFKKTLSADTLKTSHSPDEKGAGEPRLIVRKLLFEGGVIHARIVPLNKAYELKLPKFEMRDLRGENGAASEQITKKAIKKLIDMAISPELVILFFNGT